MKIWFLALCFFSSGLGTRADELGVTNLWALKLPDYGSVSSPALAPDGTIYQGTFHGWLLAVTPDGAVQWRFKAGREIKSSPAVAADGTVYFGDRDWNFYALTPAGKLKWKFATGAWVDASPALAADGTVYVGSWDKNFYALDPAGQLKWKFATAGVVDSSPAIGADGTIYFSSHDHNLYALAPDGQLKWKFTTGAEITASPTLATNGIIYISSTDGNLFALNPDGSEAWRLHTGGYTSSSPVLDETGNLYLASASEQCSLRSAGKLRWHFGTGAPTDITGAVTASGQVLITTAWARAGEFKLNSEYLCQFPSGYDPSAAPNLSPAGTIYWTDGQRLFAYEHVTNNAAAAKSSWPLWRANPQHTGRVKVR